jgi:ethanolamine permease
MIYSTSRQAFSLARAGYLPRFLGNVHDDRRTPTEALWVSSVIIIGFIVWAYFNKQAINAALLVSTITALIWYLLGIYCLFALRKKEPQLKRPYRVPLFPALPAVTAVLTLFALVMYAVVNVNIIPHTIIAYVIALAYFWLYSSKRLEQAAPEEVAARKATEDGVGEQVEFDAKLTLLDRATAVVLVVVAVSLVWMSARAMGMPAMASEAVEVSAIAILFTVALGATCVVAWRSTSPAKES